MLIGLLIVVAVLAVLTPVAVDRARRRNARTGGYGRQTSGQQTYGQRDGLAYLPESNPGQMPWTDPGLPQGGSSGHHHGGHHHGHVDSGGGSHHSHHGHHDSGSSWSGSSGSSDFGGGGHHHG